MASTTSPRSGIRTAADPAARARQAVRRVEVWAGGAAGVVLAIGTLITLLAGAGGTVAPPGREAPRAEFRPFVADARGIVEVRPAGATTWRPIAPSQPFAVGDALRTGPDATCDVLVAWGASFRLEAAGEVVWKRIARDGQARRLELELVAGRVLPAVGGLPAGSRFDVRRRQEAPRLDAQAVTATATGGAVLVSTLAGIGEGVDATDPRHRARGVADDVISIGTARPWATGPGTDTSAATDGPRRATRPGAGTPGPDGTTGPGTGALTTEGPGMGSAPGATAPVRAAPAGGGALSAAQEEVASLLERGIGLLDEGRVTAALELCTPTFRAVIEGAMSGVSGATHATEVSRADAVALAAGLTARLTLRLRVEALTVVVDRDTAYGTAIVTATAMLAGTGRPVARRYGCTARCVRSGGRWLVDFVTAGEGG